MEMFNSMKLVKTDTNGSDLGLIGRGIEITGDIQFTDKLQVDGKVSGKLRSENGTLILGETGHLEAQVDVGTCVIFGAVHGDLVARTRVEIRRSGRINGDVTTPVLLVEEGATFNGAIRMGQEATGRLLEKVRPAEESGPQRKIKGA